MISGDEIQRCFNALSQVKTIAYDTETSGLDWRKNFVCGYVITVGPGDDETWYLPVRHKSGGNIPGCRIPDNSEDYQGDIHPIERRLSEVAARTDLHVIGHHLKFDLHFSANHGIWFKGPLEDTMINASLINELQDGFDLETCAQLANGVPPKDTEVYGYIKSFCDQRGIPCQSDKRSMANFWITPGDGRASQYARQDGQATWGLREWQTREIVAQELDRVWSVECRVVRTLFRMERRGIPVDDEIVAKVDSSLDSMIAKVVEASPIGSAVRDRKALQTYFESIGRTDWPQTTKGAPSFVEAWLKTFPEGEDIIGTRRATNLRSTFMEGSIKKWRWRGNVHCNFNQLASDGFGTVSGRLSCNDPNMLQIPKRDKILAPFIRQVYRPKKPFRWWSSDYSQQEYRVFAEYAKAKLVLEAYKNDPHTDYHQLVADLLGVLRDPDAKRINLGTIYNMGITKLAATLGVPYEVAQGYMNKMRALMPEARGFNQEAQRRAEHRGYVKTKLGRRRRFPGGLYAHKAGNGIIQGSSADITKTKMVEIDEFLESENAESQIILQTYDSIDFLYIEEERALMDEAMRMMASFGPQDLIQLEVPMVVDISQGDSWGHASFPKYDKWV